MLRILLQNGAPAELVKPYSRVSYAGPSSSGLGPGYRPLARRGGGGLYPSVTSSAAAADLDDVISIKSYPGAFVGGRSVARTTRRPLPGLDDLEVCVRPHTTHQKPTQLSSIAMRTNTRLSKQSW